MAALSLAALALSEQRQWSPISATANLTGELSASTADRWAPPIGPGAAVGTEDGTASALADVEAAALAAGTARGAAAALVVGTAVAAGTRLGWVVAASAAATAIGAEECRYVQ